MMRRAGGHKLVVDVDGTLEVQRAILEIVRYVPANKRSTLGGRNGEWRKLDGILQHEQEDVAARGGLFCDRSRRGRMGEMGATDLTLWR